MQRQVFVRFFLADLTFRLRVSMRFAHVHRRFGCSIVYALATDTRHCCVRWRQRMQEQSVWEILGKSWRCEHHPCDGKVWYLQLFTCMYLVFASEWLLVSSTLFVAVWNTPDIHVSFFNFLRKSEGCNFMGLTGIRK